MHHSKCNCCYRFDEFDEAIEEAIEEDIKEAEGGGMRTSHSSLENNSK